MGSSTPRHRSLGASGCWALPDACSARVDNGLTNTQSTLPRSERAVPESLRSLFWEHDFDCLSWEEDAGLITGRVLSRGTWTNIQCLRAEAGDEAIRDWMTENRGRGLSPRQLRFWQIIFGFEKRQVDGWLREPGRRVWNNREMR